MTHPPTTPKRIEKHEWKYYPDLMIGDSNFEMCRKCGVVRRRDKKESACPGTVHITLREIDRLSTIEEEQHEK